MSALTHLNSWERSCQPSVLEWVREDVAGCMVHRNEQQPSYHRQIVFVDIARPFALELSGGKEGRRAE
jgi:hypothetical protein